MTILSGENIPAPDAIHELVERFDYNLASYKSGQYNEAQLRLEFLNPFFEALGWDVHNKKGYAENYKEVIYLDVGRNCIPSEFSRDGMQFRPT